MMIAAINRELEQTGKRERFDIKFSTVANYFDSVYSDAEEASIKWSTKTDDFWAYDMQSTPNHFWTGYFSTNQPFKKKVCQYSDFVQSATQLSSLNTKSALLANQDQIMETLSIM